MQLSKTTRLIVAAGFALGGVANAPTAMAGGGCPQCATEPTQIMNNVQLVVQYAKQVQQHATQVQNYMTNAAQLRDMLVQATQFNLAGQLKPFLDIANSLRSLGQTVQVARSLAYSMDNLDGKFRAQFKGYLANPNVGGQYRDWATSVNATMESTMKGMELTRKEIDNETTFAEKLRDMAKTSQGRNQMEQTLMAYADTSVTQMQKLRTLMLMDMQSKQAYQAYQVNSEMMIKANDESLLRVTGNSQTKANTSGRLQ